MSTCKNCKHFTDSDQVLVVTPKNKCPVIFKDGLCRLDFRGVNYADSCEKFSIKRVSKK